MKVLSDNHNDDFDYENESTRKFADMITQLTKELLDTCAVCDERYVENNITDEDGEYLFDQVAYRALMEAAVPMFMASVMGRPACLAVRRGLQILIEHDEVDEKTVELIMETVAPGFAQAAIRGLFSHLGLPPVNFEVRSMAVDQDQLDRISRENTAKKEVANIIAEAMKAAKH